MVFSPNHLAQPLTPYPLPTKDGGVLRTIGDARAYMLALPKERANGLTAGKPPIGCSYAEPMLRS